MNNLSRIVLSAALTALALPVASQEAERPVAVKTAGLPDHVRARIEAKAQEGPSSLIRYINSTRHLHNLRVEEIVVSEAETGAVAKKSDESTKVAEKDRAAK